MTRSLKRTLIAVCVVWVGVLAVAGYRFAQWQQEREFEKGIELFEVNELKQAEAHFRRAKMWGPRAWDIREQLGLVLLRAGRFEDALREFENAARLAPRQAVLYLEQGFCYSHLKRYRDARQAYLKAAKADPQSATAFWLAASMSQKLGENEAAETYLRKVLAINPKDKEATERLALLTEGKGHAGP